MPVHSDIPSSRPGDIPDAGSGGITRRYLAPSVPVTRVYPGEEVTARYSPKVTLPFPEDVVASPNNPGGLSGVLVADRYRVLEGPLGGVTGEAEVFLCRDEHTATEVAVKIYRYQAHSKEEVIRQLRGVHHPHVLCLLTVGQWGGALLRGGGVLCWRDLGRRYTGIRGRATAPFVGSAGGIGILSPSGHRPPRHQTYQSILPRCSTAGAANRRFWHQFLSGPGRCGTSYHLCRPLDSGLRRP
ncbi:hypothetical protein CCP3SC1_830004 [Gammaproteobacteria bacterium]